MDFSQAVPAWDNLGNRDRAVGNGWIVIYDGNLAGTASNWTRETDPVRGSVWKIQCEPGTWTDGHGCGNVSPQVYGTQNELYLSLWVKWDATYEWHQISNKFLRLSQQNFLLQTFEGGRWLWAHQLTNDQLFPAAVNTPITLGVWHQIEMVIKRGTPGRVRIWLDGQLRTDRNDLPVTDHMDWFSLDSHLGGGGMTKTRTSYRWVDHVLIARP
jgi:hypothetical protein